MELIFFTPMVGVTLLFLLFETGTYKHEINLAISLFIFTVCTIFIQLGFINATLKLSLTGYTFLVIRSIFKERKKYGKKCKKDDDD